MKFKVLVSYVLLSTLALLLLSTTVQAAEYKEVNTDVKAEDILKHIEKGDDINLTGCRIVGELNLNTIELDTVPNPNNENNNVIKSKIAIKNSIFENDVNFSNILFGDSVRFSHVNFNSGAWFYGSNFNNNADFSHVNFNSGAWFYGSNFNNNADFSYVNFNSSAWFYGSNFNNNADFSQANFNNVDFSHVKFNNVDFSHVKFNSYAEFFQVNFNSSAKFMVVNFYDFADFSQANFNSDAKFMETNFNRYTLFDESNFNSNADFSQVNFGYVRFLHANFYSDADFSQATFYYDADFSQTNFYSDADFSQVDFISDAKFMETNFNSGARLTGPEKSDNIFTDGKSCDMFRKSYESETQYGKADTIYYNYRKLCQDDKDLTSLSKWSDFISWATCGYGLKPLRIFWLGVLIVGFFACLFWRMSGIYRSSDIDTKKSEVSFWDALYFSINTFTTLGSADWYPKDNFRRWVTLEGLCGWISLGIFMASLANILIR